MNKLWNFWAFERPTKIVKSLLTGLMEKLCRRLFLGILYLKLLSCTLVSTENGEFLIIILRGRLFNDFIEAPPKPRVWQSGFLTNCQKEWFQVFWTEWAFNFTDVTRLLYKIYYETKFTPSSAKKTLFLVETSNWNFILLFHPLLYNVKT